MEEFNEETMPDTKIYLNITWTDIGLALLTWIKTLITFPMRWLATQFNAPAIQDEPVEVESSLIR
jgi:hypothetical protein